MELSEDDPADRDRLSTNTSQLHRAINENTVLVNEVQNSAKLASVRTVVDQADTTDFQVIFERLNKIRE